MRAQFILSLVYAISAVAANPLQRCSSGCGKSHNFVGQTKTFSIQSSGGKREYRIHLPSGYNKDKQRELLIAYHGSGDNATNFEKTTRFSDPSVNPNMIVVYPKGVNNNWQGPSYATPGVSDKVFTTDLVKHISDNYCIDTSRIYATGHSNGGGLVGTLACSPEHGGQFAAFAPISGAFYTDVTGNDNCHPSRTPLPMLEVHGGADPTISYNGGRGRGGQLPSIPDWLNRWAGRDQCSCSAEIHQLPNHVQKYSWTCGGKQGLLTHYKLDKHDHSWPGRDSELDVSPLVIDFLSSYSRP